MLVISCGLANRAIGDDFFLSFFLSFFLFSTCMFSFLNFYAKYKMNRNLEKYHGFETLRQIGDELTHIRLK